MKSRISESQAGSKMLGKELDDEADIKDEVWSMRQMSPFHRSLKWKAYRAMPESNHLILI